MVKIYQDYKENCLSEETDRLTSLARQSEGEKSDDAFSDLSEIRAAGIKENLYK